MPRRRGTPPRVAAELAGLDRIIAARVLLTDIAQTSIKTHEKGMRANDGSFAALLLIEGLDEAAVRTRSITCATTLTRRGSRRDRRAAALPPRLQPAEAAAACLTKGFCHFEPGMSGKVLRNWELICSARKRNF